MSLAERRAWTLDVVVHLVAREFRLRYRRAVLGWLWAVGQPLARLVVLTFLFTRVVPLDIPNYPVFLFTGLIAWRWFSSGVTSATSSAIERRDLLYRPRLSRATVPIVSLLTDGLDYLAALPILLIFIALSGGVPATALALPAILAVQFLLMAGLGFALCTLNVFLRDVRHLVNLVLLLGFYATPIFYRAESVPAAFKALLLLNPMAHLLQMHRDVLVVGRLPDPQHFLLLTAVCVAVAAAGFGIFRKTSPNFVDEL
jgi:lipopolysaccharide transport system permease protein